jgi:malate synthase
VNVRQQFADLFGVRTINGRTIDVDETIAALVRELRRDIDAALAARRALLESNVPVREKYAWPSWEETFEDPASGVRTFREIVQGLIDNGFGRETPLRWRLNEDVPIPRDAHPLDNPGLELTGPWHPIEMAFNALNSAAPMNMPDFEDASPAHFRPAGAPGDEPIGVFAALRNAKQILEGAWRDRSHDVTKKGQRRSYRITKPPSQWPTRFVRPPGIHVRFDALPIDNAPAPGLIVVAVLWVLNNFAALTAAGTGVYFYIPKIQTPQEALIVEKLLARLEEIVGAPIGSFKIKVLYEEGNGGRYLPAIAWALRRRLLGTNVGRWDYLGSLIEMWKDDPAGVYPDPQTIGMASSSMIAYQRYNALVMLLAGIRDGELKNGAPIGGMAAVMIYPRNDPYGRSRYNSRALRAMTIDKLRERLLGLMTLNGTLHDAYRQSWVASPETLYVEAGMAPLTAPVEDLQSIVDGLDASERAVFVARGLLTADGKISPWLVDEATAGTPEALLSRERWDAIYLPPDGPGSDITIEHVQHAFYMATNYGFQILNGNFAAAIDDYELLLRFMNDLATYRIDVSWLWTLLHHHARVTKDGWLKGPQLTGDGVVPAANVFEVKAGTPVTRDLFEKILRLHEQWTNAFFAEQDRRGEPSRFDRSKAPVIMEVLRRQLLSPRYIQHSATVLFDVAAADGPERVRILDAVFG